MMKGVPIEVSGFWGMPWMQANRMCLAQQLKIRFQVWIANCFTGLLYLQFMHTFHLLHQNTQTACYESNH